MQYDRIATLSVGTPGGAARVFNGFKLKFEVEKDVTATPNKCRVEIYNLSENTRSKFKEYESVLQLNAGYVQDSGAQLLFQGEINLVNHSVKQPDVITKLQSGDGFKSMRECRSSISLSPGASINTALQTVAKALGMPIKDLPASDKVFANGFSHIGPASEQWRQLANANNFETGVQDGMLVAVPRYNTTTEAAILVDAAHGMIGSPEKCIDGQDRLKGVQPPIRWKVKTLLNPRVNPFRRVQLVSRFANGVFRVQKVRHTGDTWGDEEWVTEMELCSTIVLGPAGNSLYAQTDGGGTE